MLIGTFRPTFGDEGQLAAGDNALTVPTRFFPKSVSVAVESSSEPEACMLSDGERARFAEIAEQFARPDPQRRDRRAATRVVAVGSVAGLAVIAALAAAGPLGERATSRLLAFVLAVVGVLAAVALIAYLGLMVRLLWEAAREVRRAHLRDQR